MTIQLQTHIRAATVYRNGALVVREGTLRPEDLAEADALLLPGLPLLLRADSLRLRVQGAGLQADPLEEVPALLSTVTAEPPEDERERLKAIQREARAVQAELETLRALRETVAPLQVAALPSEPADRPAHAPAVSAWLALEDLAAARADRLDAAIGQREERLRTLASAESGLKASWQRPLPARSTRMLRVPLRRAADAPSEPVQVTLEYFVPGARWAPVYAVHIDSRTLTARLQMGAQLAQATGEDWQGVAVSMSTIDLQREATAPRPDSWRIGRHSPPRPDWRPLPEGLDGLFADYDRAAKDRPDSPPPEPTPSPSRPKPPPAPPPAPAPVVRPSMAMEAASFAPPSGAPMAMSAPMPSAMPSGAFGGAPPADMAPPRGRGGGGAPEMARKRSVGSRSMARDEMDEDAPAEEELGSGFAEASPGEGAPAAAMLDYAWLRLADASDRRRRGKLLPVDLLSDLRAFIEVYGEAGAEGQLKALSQALDALRATSARLAQAPLPAGCTELTPSSFQHRYPAGPRVDLPSDAVFRRVGVLEAEGRCRLLLRVVPRQDARVFRFALLENPARRPLLPGPIQVHLDGEFMVTGRLGASGAGATLSLNLGVEDRVRVARNTTFQQSEHGMITTSSRLEHRVQLEVRASLPAPTTLEVYERLPERADEREEIKLDLAETSPPPSLTGHDPDGHTATGALRWDLTLATGHAAVSYRYTIDISARKELVGGNRREP